MIEGILRKVFILFNDRLIDWKIHSTKVVRDENRLVNQRKQRFL
jgi:hypothetical protein